jgi:serine protease AprX
MNRIKINGVTFDPRETRPVARAAAPIAPDAAKSNYILIQVNAPLSPEQRRELEDKSVRIHEHVSEDTYLCGYKPADLDAIRSLPYVEWANVYLSGFKIAPSLMGAAKLGETKSLAEMSVIPGRTKSRNPRAVDIVFHSDVDPNAMREKIAALAGLAPQDLNPGRHKIRLTVPENALPALAALDEVHHIEPAPEYKLMNNVARVILGLPDPTPAPGALLGDGQIVAVADTGFDQGSTTDVHPAFTGRVLKLYALGRPATASDPDGHGTHVSGSVLGDANSAILGVRVTGAAPAAQLVLQSVLDSQGNLGGLPDDLNDLFLPPYRDDGARVHSNSWGGDGGGAYNANSSEVDDFVWNNRDCAICFAAGNEGADSSGAGRIDPGSCSPPGTAKNCITVGATENNRPGFDNGLTYGSGFGFPPDQIGSDEVADNPEGMAAFSSRGPVEDNRIKPDLVAPGTAILSTRSRATQSMQTIGWLASDDVLYFYDGGTSMATPLVAGCAAVVRQYLTTTGGIARPSAALIKAMLVNGAVPIKGQYTPPEVGAIPDISEGFGRVDIPATVGPFGANALLTFKDEATQLDAGGQEQITVAVNANHTQLKATLVWTDPAGETLQNDLDLIVQGSSGEERHGNVAAGSTDFDRTNNVEQVTWSNPPAGNAAITVKAFRITASPQSYALVVSLT